MRARTSVSQACGSTPLSLAVTIRPYMIAARSPPRSEPQKQPGFAAEGDASEGPLGGVVGDADAAVVEEAGEGLPAAEHVVDRLAEIVVARELAKLRVQPGVEIVDEWSALLAANGEPL